MALVQPQLTHKLQMWPATFLRILVCLPVLHLALLWIIPDHNQEYATFIHLLRPIGIAGSVCIIVLAAMMQEGQRRWAWGLQALALGGGASFICFYLIGKVSVEHPALQILATSIYICSLVGSGIYLQHRAFWIGNKWRAIVAGVSVGYAFFVIASTLLPITMSQPLSTSAKATLVYIAYDIGLLFTLGIISLRHGLKSTSIMYISIGTILLLVADIFTLINVWFSWYSYWNWPLYTTHSILIAVAAYRDTKSLSQQAETKAISAIEWMLWTVVPLGSVLSALGVAAIIGNKSPILVVILVLVAILHESIAMFDYQRVTVALHKARLEAADVATMRERTRIARDFHDTIGAHLSGLTMHLRGAKAVLTADPARARESIVQAQQIVKEAATDVRSTIDALRMPTPSHRSLDDLITKLIERNKAAGIPTDFRICGTPYGLSASVTEALYRVVQEGLTNIRKHAQATQVVVQLDYRDPRHVGLMIDDNGQGTDQPEGGFGFIGIQERVAQLNGTVQITTAPGQGLRLAVEVPV